jgi:hypothetical protein
MNEPKNFLSRWSRRKLEPSDDASTETAAPESAANANVAPAEPAFDVASLPSIESLGAGSDIRAFLQRGVPAGLTRAALRRAWSADPAIRDFIGLSENAWDFNAPNSISGFGSLDIEDAKRLAAEFFEQLEAPKSPGSSSPDRNPLVQSASLPEESAGASVHEMRETEIAESKPDQVHRLQKPEDEQQEFPVPGQGEVDVAVQHEEQKPEYNPASSPKRHGGALPQ